jgi:predicted nucleotidyltransferase
MISMSAESDELAAAAARDFARAVSARWEAQLGVELLGVYLIGSLAHGGYSRRYSDIDMALITEAVISPAVLATLRGEADKVSADLAAKLSVFWADRGFTLGRFPALDRVDYLDHRVALVERECTRPSRPTPAGIRAYLSGAPFANWAADARRFAAAEALDPRDYKSYLRVLLYPARFVFSWMTGRMASNDDAVTFLNDRAPAGLDVDLMARALECRRAAAEPDRLFPARTGLPRQIAACAQLVAENEADARQ